MDPGELITRWTVRVALALYAALLGMQLARAPRAGWRAAARWTWTLALAAYLAHVASAFSFYHGWSHRAAYEATARDTRQVVGFDWGGGLYFNYALTLLWVGDVIWWWTDPDGHAHRRRWLAALWHGFLALMVFNATVVFESGATRAAAIVGCVILLACWWRGRSRRAVIVVR